MSRISGKNMTHTMDPSGIQLEVEEISLSIEDSGAEAMDAGRPNGFLEGEVKASGEITVDLENFALITAAADDAGSYSALPVQDFVFYANVEGFEDKVEAFGCKLYLSDVINYKSAGGEKLLRKIPYKVTGRDFVKINGVPYLAEEE